MITLDGPEAYGYTIFCDDIRQEIGGKLTFVGCYSGTMFVLGAFPVTLPKFALGVVYMQQHDKVVLPLKLMVFVPGDADDAPSIQIDAPEEATAPVIAAAKAAAERTENQKAYATAFMQFGLANFQIKQPGIIKVRAVRGDHFIRLGALEVFSAPVASVPPEGDTPKKDQS